MGLSLVQAAPRGQVGWRGKRKRQGNGVGRRLRVVPIVRDGNEVFPQSRAGLPGGYVFGGLLP